jgi:hypothetical protein
LGKVQVAQVVLGGRVNLPGNIFLIGAQVEEDRVVQMDNRVDIMVDRLLVRAETMVAVLVIPQTVVAYNQAAMVQFALYGPVVPANSLQLV